MNQCSMLAYKHPNLASTYWAYVAYQAAELSFMHAVEPKLEANILYGLLCQLNYLSSVHYAEA